MPAISGMQVHALERGQAQIRVEGSGEERARLEAQMQQFFHFLSQQDQ